MLARLPAQPGCTGRTKANDELPSPSAVSGRAKLREKSSSPSAVRPAIRCAPAASGSTGGGVDHEGGVQIEFAVGVCTAPQEEGLWFLSGQGRHQGRPLVDEAEVKALWKSGSR